MNKPSATKASSRNHIKPSIISYNSGAMHSLHFNKLQRRLVAVAVVLLAVSSGCTGTAPPGPPAPVKEDAPFQTQQKPVAPVTAAKPATATPGPSSVPHTQVADWGDLPGWGDDDLLAAWQTFRNGCVRLAAQTLWQTVCAAAETTPANREAVRLFFEHHFLPYRLVNSVGSSTGLATGYYEPLLRGSRTATRRYRYPLYGTPEDLLRVDLSAFGLRDQPILRGRLENGQVVPYFDRGRIESGEAPARGKEIAWVQDPVELFFLQIQGSGRIALPDGSFMRVGFAEHNGHPYRSIGRYLIEQGELSIEQASMQGIKAWARKHPTRLQELLNHNPRYVFFRELPVAGRDGPPGALNVPLTAMRSIAIDPRYVPLGAPVFLSTTWPLSDKPLNRLMAAQDTGSAIRGAVRADFFWGFGDEAGKQAGRMRQTLRMWVLIPRNTRNGKTE